MASRIIGCGGYLPSKILTNDDLSESLETSDEWIKSRTGISRRHIAAEDEFCSHLAYKATLSALADANIEARELDLIIVCSTTPDNSFPGVATKLQGYLKVRHIPAFDLQAVCSGFIFGMHVADSLMKSGKYKTILLVCAEKMTSLLDWKDRSTAILFGDGAGAVILRGDSSESNIANSGIIDSNINSDGTMFDLLYTDGGISSTKTSGKIRMNGREVFKLAVERMSESIKEIMQKNNLGMNDIDYLIPHQANIRIINSIAAKVGIEADKIIITVEKHANCSAASIPLALYEHRLLNKFKTGDIIVFTAFGAGATWGSLILRW